MIAQNTPILRVAAWCLVLGLSGCSSPDLNTKTDEKADLSQTDTLSKQAEKTGIDEPVIIGAFSEFPDGIDGCSCYFSQHSSALESGSYIFVTNFESLAFMQLNDKMVQFKLDETTELKDGKLMERWSNANFTLTKKTMATGQLDETWQHTGTITIKPKNGAAIESTIVGECGC